MDVFDIIDQKNREKQENKMPDKKIVVEKNPKNEKSKISLWAIEFYRLIKQTEYMPSQVKGLGSMDKKRCYMLRLTHKFVTENPEITHEEFMQILENRDLKDFKKLANSYVKNSNYDNDDFVDRLRKNGITDVALNILGGGRVDLEY